MHTISINYQQLLQNLEYLNVMSFADTLIKLMNYEIDVREQNMIQAMVKVGAFPH